MKISLNSNKPTQSCQKCQKHFLFLTKETRKCFKLGYHLFCRAEVEFFSPLLIFQLGLISFLEDFCLTQFQVRTTEM